MGRETGGDEYKASKSGCGTREREKNKPLPSIFTPGSTDYQTDYLPYSG